VRNPGADLYTPFCPLEARSPSPGPGPRGGPATRACPAAAAALPTKNKQCSNNTRTGCGHRGRRASMGRACRTRTAARCCMHASMRSGAPRPGLAGIHMHVRLRQACSVLLQRHAHKTPRHAPAPADAAAAAASRSARPLRSTAVRCAPWHLAALHVRAPCMPNLGVCPLLMGTAAAQRTHFKAGAVWLLRIVA
jgi:hypothetical protein